MNLPQLLTWSYWLSTPLAAAGWAKWFWSLTFLGAAAAGLVFKLIRLKARDGAAREAWRRFANLFLAVGVIGLIWLFFRQEQIVFLGWRFWLLLLFAGAGVDLFFCLRYLLKRFPAIRAKKEERALKEKYLP